jgi:hypothetical protein
MKSPWGSESRYDGGNRGRTLHDGAEPKILTVKRVVDLRPCV